MPSSGMTAYLDLPKYPRLGYLCVPTIASVLLNTSDIAAALTMQEVEAIAHAAYTQEVVRLQKPEAVIPEIVIGNKTSFQSQRTCLPRVSLGFSLLSLGHPCVTGMIIHVIRANPVSYSFPIPFSAVFRRKSISP